MKKSLFIILSLVIGVNSYAFKLSFDNIDVTEPEFANEIYLVTDTNSYVPLVVEHAKQKTTANWGAALFGVAKGSSYYEFNGNKSPVTLTNEFFTNDDLYIIVSGTTNSINPTGFIRIIPMEIQKNRRICNIATYSTFTGSEAQTNDLVIFEAKKYKTHSYIIHIKSSELAKLRDNNSKEMKKYGKQYMIQFLNMPTTILNDFFTFGIEPLK